MAANPVLTTPDARSRRSRPRGSAFVATAAALAGWCILVLFASPASAAPANDNFAAAQQLVGPVGMVTGSTVDATGEPGEPSHDGKFATPRSVWYRWTAPESGRALVSTARSGFTTVLAVYTGSSLDGLTLVTTSGPRPSAFGFGDAGGTVVSFNATAGVTYRIAVDGRQYCEAVGYLSCGRFVRQTGPVTLQYSVNPPPNDGFASPSALTNAEGIAVGSNRRATFDDGEPNHAGAVPNASIWYAWTAPESGPATVSTRGSSFDTVLAVYTGDTLGFLTPVASDDNWGVVSTQSKVLFTATAGTTYRIAVDGVGGTRGDVTLQYSVNPPANDELAAAEFLPNASGTTGWRSNSRATAVPGEPAHWFFNPPRRTVWFTWTPGIGGTATINTAYGLFDTVLAVYTGDTAVSGLTPVAANDDWEGSRQSKVVFTATPSTTYKIAVDGLAGAHGSFRIQYSVAPPANDDLGRAQVLSGAEGTAVGTTVRATAEPDERRYPDRDPKQSVWYSWTAPESGPAVFTTRGSSFDTALSVYAGTTMTGLTPVADNNDFGGSVHSKVVFTATAGTTYSIAVNVAGPDAGSISLQYAVNRPGNDDFSAPLVLQGLEGRVVGSNVRSTGEPGEPAHAGSPATRSLWYTWVAPASGPATFTTFGSTFDTALAVYTGSAIGTLTQVGANDDWGGNIRSKVRFNAVQGTTYRIAVAGWNGATGDVTLVYAGLTPANDDFDRAQGLSGRTGSVTGSNVRATPEPGEPWYAASFPPDRSVWYAWTAPATGRVVFATTGSSFDSLLMVSTGSSLASAAPVASDDDGGPGNASLVAFDAVAGTTYRIAVGVYPGAAPGALKLSWAYPPPAVSIGDVAAREFDGATTLHFPVTLSGPTDVPVSVSFTTGDGTATAPDDYTATSGTLTFQPGELSKSLTVTVIGELLPEADETFVVALGNPVGVTIARASATGTILDDDTVPQLSISDARVSEGNAGTVDITFTATLSSTSFKTVTANWATADGTAKAPDDYTASTGSLMIMPGQTSTVVNIKVRGDVVDEHNEFFSLVLSSPSNATVGRAKGFATIFDDDAAPALSIADASVIEGASGTRSTAFLVSLSAPSEKTVTVAWSTANGTAMAPADYTAASGVLTFLPGETTKIVNVHVNGDTVLEPDETFLVSLSSPTEATLGDGLGVGTIVNDD